MTRSLSVPDLPPGARFARPRGEHANHHIWRNSGGWWFHATVHLPGYRKQRLRLNLRTHDVEVARSRRDAILASAAGRARQAPTTASERPAA